MAQRAPRPCRFVYRPDESAHVHRHDRTLQVRRYHRSMSSTGSIQIVRGACGHDCPDTCGWIVEVHNGTAGKLYGAPAHPFTRGTLCAKVNHYLERVYHPDRVLHPLKRVGPKGEGTFVRVSWDDALTDIAGRWRAIVGESGAE